MLPFPKQDTSSTIIHQTLAHQQQELLKTPDWFETSTGRSEHVRYHLLVGWPHRSQSPEWSLPSGRKLMSLLLQVSGGSSSVGLLTLRQNLHGASSRRCSVRADKQGQEVRSYLIVQHSARHTRAQDCSNVLKTMSKTTCILSSCWHGQTADGQALLSRGWLD